MTKLTSTEIMDKIDFIRDLAQHRGEVICGNALRGEVQMTSPFHEPENKFPLHEHLSRRIDGLIAEISEALK